MEDELKKSLLEDSSFKSMELLDEAVRSADALQGGSLGKSGGKRTALGKALATLNNDKVEIGNPDVFTITNNSFYKKKFKIPVDLSKTFDAYQFVYVEFPIGLKTRSNWSFNKYRLFIEFENKDIKVLDMLPSDQLKEIFRIGGDINIGIDANLNFKVATPEINLQKGGAELKGHAGAGVDAGGKLSFIKPPFVYSVKKWEVKTEGRDLYYIDWEFFSIDEMKSESRNLKAILRIPKDLDQLKMKGTLVAYRNPDSMKAAMADIFNNFSEILSSWFSKGIPISSVMNLDLLDNVKVEI